MVDFEDITNIVSSRLVFYPLILVSTCLWLLHRWQTQSRTYRMGYKLPGPTPVPFFGNALLAIGKRPEDIISNSLFYADKYGTVVRGWLGTKLYIFLLDPNDVETILSSQEHIEKSSEYKLFKPWLGEGLLISSGEKWRSHRKMIAPTFHINILKSFMDIFNANSVNVVNKMRAEEGRVFDVHDYMGGVTVDILLETAMGINKETNVESGDDYAMAVMKMCNIIHQRHYKVWLQLDSIFKFTQFYQSQKKLLSIIHGLTNKVIKLKKEQHINSKGKESLCPEMKTNKSANETRVEETPADNVFKGYRDDLDLNDENDIGEKKRLAFLDLLIESVQNGTNNISDQEMKEEVDTIMFEGHDTTAAGSSFVQCLLGIHQNIQNKVYNELYEIFGDSDRPVTYEDTLEMKYLERVILETLRMYPPVPGIARKLNADVQIPTKGYVLPAGATIVIGTLLIHRHPKYYKNPNVFDPDNFLPENTQNRHYYSYIPFSAGPRSCVGRKYALLKLKVLLATILRNYKVTSNVKEDEYQLQADIILKRSDGFRLQLEPRNRAPTSCL